MAGYEVITAALKAEAKKWDALAAAASGPRDHAEAAALLPTAFLLVDPTGIAPAVTWDQLVSSVAHQQSYEAIRGMVATLLSGAVTEFGQIADALIKVAKAYDDAERVVELDLKDIYTA